MKKVLSVFLSVAMIISLVACGSSGDTAQSEGGGTSVAEAGVDSSYEYPEMTIIIAHSGATTDARQNGAEAIKEYIETESGGNITVDVYPAGQLGDSNTIIETVQNGGIQMCIQPPSNVVAFDPLLGILDVPYFFPTDLEKAREVFNGDAAQMLLDTMRDYDMVGLGYWPEMFKAFTSNKELRKPEDFVGLKFRVMASPVLIEMIEALGGTALTIDYQETFTALQTGAIDGQEAGIGAGIYNMKFYEVQNYMELTNHILPSQLIFASESWFDGLDEQCQQLVLDAVNVAGNDSFQVARSAIEEEALAAIGEQCEIIELTEDELAAMADACRQPCLDLFIADNGEAGQEILDAFNADIAALE